MVDYNEIYARSTKTLTPYSDDEVTDVYVRLEIIMREIETAFAHFGPLFDSALDEMLRRNLIKEKAPVTGGQSTQGRKQP